MPDAFGCAIRDFHRNEQDEPLIQRDGEDTVNHPIQQFYFDEFADAHGEGQWLESWIDGPLLDLGAGAGRDTLYFQRQFETVAIEVSDNLVETMDARGVEDARRGDMFRLREQFDADCFRSALSIGTQACLAGSMQGLRSFLADLAYVTTPEATVVLDSYDPSAEGAAGLLGYREDATSGLAHRVMWFEYEDEVDPVLHFRLFAPARVRDAAQSAGWGVADIRRLTSSLSCRVALTKG